MAAGLSVQAEKRITYRMLKRVAVRLWAAGILCEYKNHTLSYADAQKSFVVYCVRLNASNGEAALLPHVSITVANKSGTGKTERYDHLSFERGIERIKELFGKKQP